MCQFGEREECRQASVFQDLHRVKQQFFPHTDVRDGLPLLQVTPAEEVRDPVSLLHPGPNSNSSFKLSVFKGTLHRVCISLAVKTLKPVWAGLGGDWTCYPQIYWTHLYSNWTLPQNKTSLKMSGCCQQQLRAGPWNFIFRAKRSLWGLSLRRRSPAKAGFLSFILCKAQHLRWFLIFCLPSLQSAQKGTGFLGSHFLQYTECLAQWALSKYVSWPPTTWQPSRCD